MNFEDLYHQYKNLVYNLSLQYVQNIEDAEEITQDVFLSVHNGLDAFMHKASPSTWIYRITINKCLDFQKAKQRKKRITNLFSIFGGKGNALQFDHPDWNHPGILLEHKSALENLFKHINQLPHKQKTVLILSKIEQKSQVEIADIMNLSTKAVESLMQRAKKNLKENYLPTKDK